MTCFLKTFVLLLPACLLQAQTDSLRNSRLREVTVSAGAEKTMGMTRLRAVEGVAIFEGKKSEVVSLRDLTANMSANNPRQVFGRVAGLNIWESDGAGLQLGIGGRGLSPNRTSNFNTRQNGYDISADALGYPESYYTPPFESLTRIEVVRGAASLQYGTQFGGLLNFVVQQPPRDQPFRLVSRQTAGAFGFFGSYNAVSGSTGNLGYFGFYQYKRGDGWRPNAGFQLHNGYLDLHYRFGEKAELGLELTKMQYLAQQPGGLTDVQFDQNPRQSLRPRNWFAVDWNLACLALDLTLGPRTRLNNRTFGLLASRQSLGNLMPANNLDFGQNRDLIEGAFRNIGNETRLLHHYTWAGNEHSVAFGTRIYRGVSQTRQGAADNGSDPDFEFLTPGRPDKSDFKFPNHNLAVFAENIFRVNSRFSITPGVRWEYIRTRAKGRFHQKIYDLAGNLVSESQQNESLDRPRTFVLFGVGASWKPSGHHELYANCSQNYRAINFTDLRVDNPNVRVNPNIRDERGFTADLGWRTRGQSWWYADVTAFFIAYKGRIGQVLRADQPPTYLDYRYRTNVADAHILGIEAFSEVSLLHLLAPADTLYRLTVFLNASVTDARYGPSGDASIRNRRVELVPPLTLRSGLTAGRGPLRLSFTWAWTAAHYSDATNAERTASAVNGKIPAYTVADFSAAYAWKRWTLEASCNNLFNATYFTRRADAYPGPGIIPADGRAWFVTLGIKL